jgi:hypothetical protein
MAMSAAPSFFHQGQASGRHQAPRLGPGVHLRAWIHRADIDRKLADGVSPALRPELSLRARQLQSPSTPRTLATALRRAARSAERHGYGSAAPLNRVAVHACQRELDALAAALIEAQDPPVAALARVSRLCTWGSSALFMGPTAALSAQLERARRELSGR